MSTATAVESSRSRQIKSWYAAKAREWEEKAAKTERPAPPPVVITEEAARFLAVRTALIDSADLGPLLEESMQPAQSEANRQFTFEHARVLVLFTTSNKPRSATQ